MMQEWPVDRLFTSLTYYAFSLIITLSDSSVVTENLFLTGLRWALLLPRCIDYKGMRQDHTARSGKQREVKVGIEAAGRAKPNRFLKVVRTVGIVLLTHPDQQVIDGQSLPIERWFTRWKQTLPRLWLIDEIKPCRDWQWRIDEELLQRPSSGREARLGVNPARLAISTAARDGISFGKIQVKHRFFLLFILIEVEQ
jgi:hypothetical protein